MAFYSALASQEHFAAGRAAYDMVLREAFAGNVLSEEVQEILERTTSLDLSCEGLTHLHSAVCLFRNLTSLDLNNNKLRYLPFGLQSLAQLTTLRLKRNNFTSVPLEIGRIPNLQQLWRSFCCTDLPKIDGTPPSAKVMEEMRMNSEIREGLFEKIRCLGAHDETDFSVLPWDVRKIICENLIENYELETGLSLDLLAKIRDATCVAVGEQFQVVGHKTGCVTIQPRNIKCGKHKGSVNAVKLLYAEKPNAPLTLAKIFSCADDKRVIIWKVEYEHVVKKTDPEDESKFELFGDVCIYKETSFLHDRPVLDVAPFGPKKFLSKTEIAFYVMNFETSECLHIVPFPENTLISSFHPIFSEAGTEMVACCLAVVQEEDTETGEQIGVLYQWQPPTLDSVADSTPLKPTKKLPLKDQTIPSIVALSPESSLAFADHSLWDNARDCMISKVAYTTDFGRPLNVCRLSLAAFIYAIGYGTGLRLWDLETKIPKVNLTPDMETKIACVALDFNEKWVFAVFGDGSLCKWKIEDIPDDIPDPIWAAVHHARAAEIHNTT